MMHSALRPLLRRFRPAGMLAAIASIILCAVTRSSLESSMASHMLLQMPLLIAAGVFLQAVMPERAYLSILRQHWRICDQYGVCSLLAILLIATYWMIPISVERAVTSTRFDVLKFLALLIAGTLLPSGLRRANLIIQIFFIGNLCGMMAIIGIQYQDSPQRLCNSYLLDDQIATGIGLLCFSLTIPLLWISTHILHSAKSITTGNNHDT